MTVFGRTTEPPDGFRVVLHHAPTGLVHPAEVVLPEGIALFGRTPIPPHSFGVGCGSSSSTTQGACASGM